MADPKENNETTSQNKKVDYGLIQLSIPEIISALHQKAIASCPSNLRIANSAIEGDGKTAKLNSAGQHIVSVLNAEEGKNVSKKEALENLKKYVSAFVGPDLANKVTDKVLMKLGSEENGNENQGQNEEKVQNQDDQVKQLENKTNDAGDKEEEEESKQLENKSNKEKLEQSDESIDVKSFQKFLIEDCGMKFLFEENDEQQNDNVTSDNSSNEEKTQKDDLSLDQKKDNKDEKNEEALGWYIAYNLKVQGLKETNLKDAMKDFATSFFDNLKLTASGLFGGGQEVTGQQIRKSFHDLLHVDHTKLASNVAEYLRKKFPNIEDTSVEARDSKTLYKEIKDYINKDEKTAVNSAAYCLRIKVREEDRKKPFFNKKKIAEVIRKCMAGFRLGKKAAVTEDSIIKIEDFKDKHDDKEEGRNAKRPESTEIKEILSKVLEKTPDEKLKNQNAIEFFNAVKKKFDRILKNSDALKEKENKKAKEIFDSFKKAIIDAKDEEIKAEVFQKFYDEYLKFETSLGESKTTFDFIKTNDVVQSILELLFEDFSQNDLEPIQILGEEDDNNIEKENAKSSDDKKEDDIKSEKCEKKEDEIKTKWKDIVKNLLSQNGGKASFIKKENILEQLKSYSNVKELQDEFSKNEEFNYGFAIDFDKNSSLSESKQEFIVNSIMKMLFEQDLSNEEWKEIVNQHSNKKIKYPETIDSETKNKREMNIEELRTALHDDIVSYDNGEFKFSDPKDVIDDQQIKKTFEIANKDPSEIQEEQKNDIKSIFDEIKKFIGLPDSNFGQIIQLEKDVNESIKLNDSDLLLEKGHKKLDDKKWETFKKTIKANLEDIRNRKDEILKKSYEDQGQMLSFTKDEEAKNNSYNDFVKELFDSTDSVDDTIKKLNKIVHRDNFRNDIVYRFKYEPDDKKEETVKITFYDSDPESGDKKEKALGDPIEVKKGDPINSSDEAQKKIEEYNKQLKDDQQEGYDFSGWNPDPSTNADEDTELIAKYDKEKEAKKEQTFVVQFFSKDPSDENSELNIIQVNGNDSQVVPKGNKAIRPNEKDIPNIEEYEFINWGDAEDKLDSVQENIMAIAQYKKKPSKCNAYVMPIAFYEKEDDAKLEKTPEEETPPETTNDEAESGKAGGNDLYVFPIASSKDFESAPEIGND